MLYNQESEMLKCKGGDHVDNYRYFLSQEILVSQIPPNVNARWGDHVDNYRYFLSQETLVSQIPPNVNARFTPSSFRHGHGLLTFKRPRSGLGSPSGQEGKGVAKHTMINKVPFWGCKIATRRAKYNEPL